jgi:hypothetical protein
LSLSGRNGASGAGNALNEISNFVVATAVLVALIRK